MLINALWHFKAKQTSVISESPLTRSPSLYSALSYLTIAWQLKALAGPQLKLHQLAVNIGIARCQVISLCLHLLPCLHSFSVLCRYKMVICNYGPENERRCAFNPVSELKCHILWIFVGFGGCLTLRHCHTAQPCVSVTTTWSYSFWQI